MGAFGAGRKADPNPFSSFIMGGFECSTHKRADGKRLDLLAATDHDLHAEADYRQLSRYGIDTVRDGVRWHSIDRSSGVYDWRGTIPMLEAAEATGTQVIWDLMHYGWPDGLDIWSSSFVDRFEAFARAFATLVRSRSDAVPFYCPVNEISFFSWAGGDVASLNPFAVGRGFELKVQLARASIVAMEAILDIDPRARFVQCEPAVNVVAHPERPFDMADAEGFRLAQYQAWDLIAGRLWPQIGGREDLLDIIGVNYYRANQWYFRGQAIGEAEPGYRPLRMLLAEIYARYGRKMVISETGIEGDLRASWFLHIVDEVLAARAGGVDIDGICLYPIIDHLGWDDERECPSGLLGRIFREGRDVHMPLADALERQVWFKKGADR